MLQGVNDAHDFFDLPANSQVVDELVSDDTRFVDHESSPQRHGIVHQNAVAARDVLGQVRHQGETH